MVEIEERFINNFLVEKTICEDGKFHNFNGPAVEWWDEITKYKHYEAYYIQGKFHRIGAPAEIFWHEDGSIYKEVYKVNHLIHNDNGPAIIIYNINGTIANKSYYIDDRFFF